MDDEDLKDILTKPIQFKIHAAEYYLEKIPHFVPMDDHPEDRFRTELLMESFLFFALGSADILHKEINTRLNLEISDSMLTIKKIKECLTNMHSEKAQRILNILDDCSTEPKHFEKEISIEYNNSKFATLDAMDFVSQYENRKGVRYEHRWERERSWLWELRLLRNQITHQSLFRRMGVRGSMNVDTLSISLRYGAKLPHEYHFVQDPHIYFSNSLKKIKKLISNISDILNE